jgi:bifunctional non-homologous end joining protein LigD
MSLDRYRAKRDFDATPEPVGTPRASGKTLAFFIQRHHARALHYDFRIELDGVLKSWAVPKGPSLDPADKRLAVRVEDHPLEYGRFEGTIPSHQYGAGEVVLWDRGNWTPDGDPAAGLRKGHLTFALDGQKLQGRWALVRMGRADPKKENWLLIKETDAAARRGGQADITDLRPESVAGAAHARSGARRAASAAPVASVARAAGPVKARMPDFPSPQLATLSDRAPEGDQWLSEMKFDGYRGLCRIDRAGARIFTREGHDWSARWPALAAALSALAVDDAWIDGEVIALLADDSISFEALQDPEQFPGARLAFYAFDLPYLNGHDLRALPLLERKALLRDLIPGADRKLLYSDHVVGNAAEAFEHACMHGMEGIVAKRASAPYTGKRDGNWLKIKCQRRQEFVIGGFTEPGGRRAGFGALLLGIHDGAGKLHYAGRVGTGFGDAQLALLSRKFRRLERRAPAFVDPPRGSMARGVHWLAPQLLAEVKFAQWTAAGMVRHASFVALRADKPARSVVREMPSAPAGQDVPAAAAGAALSHPDKVLYPGAGLTKRDMAEYYEAVGRWMLPHLLGRPLTMVRCPDGVGSACFFQKHVAAGVPAAIARVTVHEAAGPAQYMMIEDAAGLLATVQMNGLEIHAWGASKKQLSRPDRLVFDLDPAPGVAWPKVIEGALLIRTLLQEIGLTAFLKTSGGKGLHLVLPIACNHEWPVIKAWTKGVAEHLAATLPAHFTAKISKAARDGKIFIDYLRNTEGATTVAAYSPRARANAPVSTPIAWDELGPDLRADTFTVADVPARLAQMKTDPWADYAQTRQKISAKMLRLFA